MVFTPPQAAPPDSAAARLPVLTRVEDRVLHRVLASDIVSSDDLADGLYPFVHPDDTIRAVDRLTSIGLIEVRPVSGVTGFNGLCPRRVMITQKGHDYAARVPVQDDRLRPVLLSMLTAGFLISLANAGLHIEFMGLVGFWMMLAGVAGEVLRAAGILTGRN